MRLIQQKILYCREGNSDKLYEVDLCEVGGDQYVVNFRYGRRGTALKEGTKTTAPVGLNTAHELFDELVSSKTKKGYTEVSDVPTDAVKPRQVTIIPQVEDGDPRKQAVLNRLRLKKGQWKLSRAIWRAGELKIKEALPLLLNLLQEGSQIQQYSTIWALGWCGDERAIEPLSLIYLDQATPDMLKRMACEALLKLSDPVTRCAFVQDMIAQLPVELQIPAQAGIPEDFTKALHTYLGAGYTTRFGVLDTLYLIDTPCVRPALLDILRTAPLKPNYFQRFRHIFKAAEYRRDAEVFGVLAYRFEKENALFNNQGWRASSDWAYTYVNGEYTSVKELRKMLKQPDSAAAYGSKTRTYLRQRVCRTLQHLGQQQDPDYVRMAVGVLLAYQDADEVQTRVTDLSYYNHRSGVYVQQSSGWDSFAPYWALNVILYSNSPRYHHNPGSKAWKCKDNYKPGDPEPAGREEAFPERWNQQPTALLHLLQCSKCQPVHHFAVKALRDIPEALKDLDLDTLIHLLQQPYAITSQLGFDLIQERYNPEQPDIQLVQALANCQLVAARQQAHQWIQAQPSHFLTQLDCVLALLTSPYRDTRGFTRHLLHNAVLPEESGKRLMAQTIAYAMAFSAEQNEWAKDMLATLLEVFPQQCRTLGINIIRDVVLHPLEALQAFGAQILLQYLTPDQWPETCMQALIQSEHESVRRLGVQLVGQLPDDTLILRQALLLSLATHALPDLRESIRPVIQRLATTNPSFGEHLVMQLVPVLIQREPHAGIHVDVFHLLWEHLSGVLTVIPQELAFRLVQAKSAYAQDLGGKLMQLEVNQHWALATETLEMVKLANHEVLSVRSAAWQMLLRVAERLRHDPNEWLYAVRVFDSKREDSRTFARQQLSSHFTDQDWTPSFLVNLCDSIYDDVQKFGREMIQRYFTAENGQEYLLKLSEHPAANLQLFATHYLERYATDQPERLQELVPYFKRVLAQVNRSRVAKNRILWFLAAEAGKHEASARIVTELLSWYSATQALSDKAQAIETLLHIQQQYPGLPMPLKAKPTEVRHGV